MEALNVVELDKTYSKRSGKPFKRRVFRVCSSADIATIDLSLQVRMQQAQ
jgi:hypothetical protein